MEGPIFVKKVLNWLAIYNGVFISLSVLFMQNFCGHSACCFLLSISLITFHVFLMSNEYFSKRD